MKREPVKRDDNTIRVQKYLSEKGIASRRKAAEWMELGLVLLNGEPVTDTGARFDPSKEKVTLDPAIRQTEDYKYYVFNKPVGIVTVNAQAGETEIRDIVKIPAGVVPVGRLDKDTSGLIMLTNDGVVARRIMDPAFDHEKEYEVSFYEPFTEEAANLIRQGMNILGKKTKPVKIQRTGRYMVSMILKEGKNRQIRRMCEQAGYHVKKLKRIRILNIFLDDLPKGRMRELKKVEVKKLLDLLKLSADRTASYEPRKDRRK